MRYSIYDIKSEYGLVEYKEALVAPYTKEDYLETERVNIASVKAHTDGFLIQATDDGNRPELSVDSTMTVLDITAIVANGGFSTIALNAQNALHSNPIFQANVSGDVPFIEFTSTCELEWIISLTGSWGAGVSLCVDLVIYDPDTLSWVKYESAKPVGACSVGALAGRTNTLNLNTGTALTQHLPSGRLGIAFSASASTTVEISQLAVTARYRPFSIGLYGQLVPSAYVIFIIGQSNALGRALISGIGPTGIPTEPIVGANIWWKASPTNLVDDGVMQTFDVGANQHWENPTTEFGPESRLAQRAQEKFGDHVYIVKCAVGGTSLVDTNEWHPDGENLYRDFMSFHAAPALEEIAALGMPIRVLGVVWDQGEADSAEPTQDYVDAFRILRDRLRADFDIPDLPILVRRMVTGWSKSTATILAAQDIITEEDAYTHLINADAFAANTSDSLHLNAVGQAGVSDLYWAKMEEMENGRIFTTLPRKQSLTFFADFSREIHQTLDEDGYLVSSYDRSYYNGVNAAQVALTPSAANIEWVPNAIGKLGAIRKSAETQLGVVVGKNRQSATELTKITLVRLNKIGSGHRNNILSTAAATNDPGILYLNQTAYLHTYAGGSAHQISDTPLQVGEWAIVVTRYDNGTVHSWVNSLVADGPYSIGGSISTSVAPYISSHSTGSYGLQGDQVLAAEWSIALTDGEVAQAISSVASIIARNGGYIEIAA